MEIVKLTTRGRITIPNGLRKRLHLVAGDFVVLGGEGDRIVMRRLSPGRPQAVAGMFGEWLSLEDEKAWRDL